MKDVHKTAQVKGSKHQPYVSCSSFDAFFGADKVKAPLPFYDTLGVFNNGLSLFVSRRILFDVLFVLIYEGLILASLDQTSVLILCSQGKGRTAFAFTGLVILNIIAVVTFYGRGPIGM